MFRTIGAGEEKVRREEKMARPSITLVTPFEPTMHSRGELEASLKRLLAGAEKSLMTRFDAGAAIPVIRKAQDLVKGLSYSTHRKSIAIYADPDRQTICYLDIPVEERVETGIPFRVTDIVRFRRDGTSYLLLLLSDTKSKMYWSEGEHFRLIKSNIPQHEYNREIILTRFLHHMDEGLAGVLAIYPFPVLVMAPDRVADQFSRITRHGRFIAGYIQRDWIGVRLSDLRELLAPALGNWEKLGQDLLAHQLEEACSAGKLVTGIDEVRKAAGSRNSRLLVFQDGGSSREGESSGIIDTIAQKVLENGGDIRMAAPGVLDKYARIALIRYY